MPRNRQHIPREQRVDELVVAADELFLTRGFAKTAMSDIAASTGVTNGALYWYFPTKDHILAAVMDRAVNLEIERQGDRTAEVGDPTLLLEGLDGLRRYRQLHMTMHERMSHSEVVLEAHDRFIDWMRKMARDALVGHTGENDIIVELVVAVFEGVNIPGARAKPAYELIQELFRQVFNVDPSVAR